MKNKSIILLSVLLAGGFILSSCSVESFKPKDTLIVYKDKSNVEIDDLNVKIDHIKSNQSYSTSSKGYDVIIFLSFTNNSSSEQIIDIKESTFFLEENEKTYNLQVTQNNKNIASKEVTLVSFLTAFDTPLDENRYAFSTIINDVKYVVHLYDMPDKDRNNYIVNYQIGDSVVRTVNVKENKILGENYIYENPNHLSYCNVWKTIDGTLVGANTRINDNLTLIGEEKENIKFIDINETDKKCAASSIDYISSDGVVVVPNIRNGNEVIEIGERFFASTSIKTIYLPNTIKNIKENNFLYCTSLTTINYAGTESEWNSINNLSKQDIPNNITINFEVI